MGCRQIQKPFKLGAREPISSILFTRAVGPISNKSRLTSTIERSFGIITEGIQAAVVNFDGTLVNI